MVTFKPRRFTLTVLILSVFCLFRALAVHADQYDVDEVFESRSEEGAQEDDGYSARSASIGLPDVRLTRPEEAASRRYVMYGEGEYEQVPGSEVLAVNTYNSKENVANSAAPLLEHSAAPLLGGASVPLQNRAPAAVIAVPQKPKGYAPDQELRTEPMVPASERFATQQEAGSVPPAGERLPSVSPVPTREEYSHLELASPMRNTASNSATPLSDDSATPLLGGASVPNSSARMPATRSRGLQEVSLIATDYGYFPRRIFVTQGIPVKFYLSTPGGRASCFMVDELGVKKGINPGQLDEVTFVAEAAGDYRFHCPLGSIEGVITVRASSSTGDAADYQSHANVGARSSRAPASVDRPTRGRVLTTLPPDSRATRTTN